MKEAFYFSHDANAQHDPKVIKMLSKMGWEGYGIYWALVERLRNEPEYKLNCDYDCIAFALRTDKEIVKSIIMDFELFEVYDGTFWSESLMERMKLKEERSRKAKKSALKRWYGKPNAIQSDSEPNAIKEKKVKEKKEKKINKIIIDFKDKILNQYLNIYEKDDLIEFIDYWTEPNKSNTMVKFQMEKTWDINRRLKRWMNNIWNKKDKKNKEFKMDVIGKSYIGYCSKCNKSDFYSTTNEDSVCCKKQILPKKQIMV